MAGISALGLLYLAGLVMVRMNAGSRPYYAIERRGAMVVDELGLSQVLGEEELVFLDGDVGFTGGVVTPRVGRSDRLLQTT